MLAHTIVMAALTASFSLVAAVPAAATPSNVPRCSDLRNGCNSGSTCIQADDSHCVWYYCQAGDLQSWIDCGNRDCAYQGNQPSCA